MDRGREQLDLFAAAQPACGKCRHLGPAIDSGIRHCGRWAVWRWAAERVECGAWAAA